MSREPLPIQVDGTVVVDEYWDYEGEHFYLRSITKRKPRDAAARYAIPFEDFAAYEDARSACDVFEEHLALTRIPIKEWKPEISPSPTEPA